MIRQSNMTLDFLDEQAMVLESAREFCKNNSNIAHVRSMLHSKNQQNHIGYDEPVWQQIVSLGWLGIATPEEFGGSDFGIGSAVGIAEAMGRHLLCTPFLSSMVAAQLLLRAGNKQQQMQWLPKISEGTVATLALLDNEDWGSTQSQCKALPEDGALRLTGRKIMVCDALSASVFLVVVDVEGETNVAIVTADQLSTSTIRPHTLLDETKRACEVDFSDVLITQDALLESSSVAQALQDCMLIGAMLTAAEAVGSTAASLDSTVEYLKTRKQFGKLIGSYQALKHPSVDILCKMDSAKSLLYHAASVVDSGPLNRDAEIACRMVKVAASEALLFAADRGIQFHGGMGFTYECDAQLYLRRAQWSQQQFGDAAHHRKRLAPLLLD